MITYSNSNHILSMYPKVKFFRVFMLIKNLINVYNLIYFLLYYILFNNFLPIKFNKFKYFQLMFFKRIKKYLNNIENQYCETKKMQSLTLGEQWEYIYGMRIW